eukprot:TRINITY_DN777841_c0_g1_i1.p1 TRINITY_DN777841_c0_g1~~TRINITY_DN777841_c0_g1_i1.p1  ORF type:complete len:337 (-),score=87.29 TRINITY_DN777841_c0_g1_i1:349-1359(-)
MDDKLEYILWACGAIGALWLLKFIIFTVILGFIRCRRSKHSLLYKEKRGKLDKELFPEYFANKQGMWIHYREFLVDNPIGSIFICHGYGEHVGRYVAFAKKLMEQNYNVFAIEHQGHGLSDGDRAYVERFTDYVDDLIQFVDIKTKEHNIHVKYLFGHSMGGAMALRTAMENVKMFDGVCVTGPAVGVDRSQVPSLLIKVASFLSKTFPHFKVKALSIDTLTHNDVMKQLYFDDPLVIFDKAYARTGYELIQNALYLAENAPKFTSPLLICHGSDDRICSPEMSGNFVFDAASTDKKFISIKGGYHEILNEIEPMRTETMDSILDWFKNRSINVSV